MIGKTVSVIEELGTLEDLIAFQAKVSNTEGQLDLDNAQRLLKYCADNGHWSIFEMGNFVFEIVTTRDISRQFLRHRSFSFQEFSQRYSEVQNFTIEREARLQDTKNRQNSIEIEDSELALKFKDLQATVVSTSAVAYQTALDCGIAKEQARTLLPEGLTETKMYMNGTVRSWIHYCQLRCGNGTQKEHMELANQIRDIIIKELPVLELVLKGD